MLIIFKYFCQGDAMRKRIWVLSMIFTMIASSLAFGGYFEKVYVDLDQVIFGSSGIWLEGDECYHEVDAIIFDKLENRYYVLKKEAKWQCGNCRKYNDPKRNNCWYCGWPWGPPGPND